MKLEVSVESGSITLVCRKVALESLKNLTKNRGWISITDDAEEAGAVLLCSSAYHW